MCSMTERSLALMLIVVLVALIAMKPVTVVTGAFPTLFFTLHWLQP